MADDPGLFPAPRQNPLVLTVFCRYCREPAGQPCRHTMSPGRPIMARPHQIRINDAQEVKTTVTVYTTSNCQGCTLTKRHMDRRGIAFTEIEIDDDNREAIVYLGFTSAPVVLANIAGREQSWSGYRPDRIEALLVAEAAG